MIEEALGSSGEEREIVTLPIAAGYAISSSSSLKSESYANSSLIPL
jgi:hypothetical protein